jgi:POT family proton-dependent oligopeptide transporter
MEKPADAVYTLQNLTTAPRETDSLDQFMRTVTDTAGKPIKTMGPDVYFANVPKEDWPPDGLAKVGNTELFQSINPFFIVAFTPLLILFFAYMARRNKPISLPGNLLGLDHFRSKCVSNGLCSHVGSQYLHT